jgi:UDP-N-acetylglucosamine 3-dehydrogenase
MGVLRAGLLGLGMMGRHHARVLASLDGVELVAVADPSGDAHGVAGGRPLEKDIRSLLAHGLDYCVVAVPAVHHEEVGLALAAAGVHTLIEKPLALDLDIALRLTEAFHAAGVIGAVGYVERYNPALQQARRRIAAGELGELYQAVTRRSAWSRISAPMTSTSPPGSHSRASCRWRHERRTARAETMRISSRSWGSCPRGPSPTIW